MKMLFNKNKEKIFKEDDDSFKSDDDEFSSYNFSDS